jgi:hypothetical protein
MQIAAAAGSGFKRVIALMAVYVFVLQALFAGGAQIRVLLSDTPGICTLLGFEDNEKPAHRLDACAVHCVGHASADLSSVLAIAAAVIALAALLRPQALRPAPACVSPALGFRGRAPPQP